jgi:hypothetical protein
VARCGFNALGLLRKRARRRHVVLAELYRQEVDFLK